MAEWFGCGDEGRGVLVRERVRRFLLVELPAVGVRHAGVLKRLAERRLSRRSRMRRRSSFSEASAGCSSRARRATPSSLGLLPLTSLDGARVRGEVAGDRPCVILMVGRRPQVQNALPGVRYRSALRGERGEGDIRSGAGLCNSQAVSAKAAAILVTPALGAAEPVRSKPRGTYGSTAGPGEHLRSRRGEVVDPCRGAR